MGQASAREEELLINHFESFQRDEEWDERVLGVKQQLEDKLFRNIQQTIESRREKGRRPKVIRLPLRYFRNAAAAVIAFAIIGTVCYYRLTAVRKPAEAGGGVAKNDVGNAIGNDIAPGDNKAILTLANGSRMVLDSARNGLLVRKGSLNIEKTSDGQLRYVVDKDREMKEDSSVAFNTINTPRGGEYQVILSDGTKVWINAASALKFPTAFNGHERTVELTGEAYFEVAKNADKPFYVKVNDMQVQVLGTSFNIMAYSDEPAIKTTLLEGSVRLAMGKNSHLLQPGQQGIADHRGIAVVNANTDEAIAWKNGYFEFNRCSIQDIMHQLSRWYDTDVVYESKVPGDEFVGKISRDAKLSQVLRILELSNVHFRIENKKIFVTQ